MNTPAHLLLGAAVMGRGGERKLIWAAMLGAMLPDLSLYVLAGVSLTILNIPPQRVFNEFYFSDLWQGIFAVDNSFIVWGGLLALAIWHRKAWAITLTGAALLHLALDLPLHHDDGRAHFWPLSWWKFESPVSYWDPRPWCKVDWTDRSIRSNILSNLDLDEEAGLAIVGSGLFLIVAEYRTVSTWLWFFTDS